jgi:tetratricopeptide (TPR) repeat protein
MFKYFSLILLSLLIISSCSSPKQVQQGFTLANEDQKKEMELFKKLEFENYFYEGIKNSINGNNERALENFERALKIFPKSDATYFEIGKVYFSTGKNDLALENAGKAAKIESANKWYYLLQANILHQMERYGEATQVYEQLVKLEPNNISYQYDLAASYIHANNLNMALRTYEKMEKQFGQQPDVIKQKYRIFLNQNKVDKAAEEVQKLIRANPKNMQYYKLLADIYASNKMEDKAAKIYEQMYELDPDNSITQITLVDYYRRTGQGEKFSNMLQKTFDNPQVDVDQKIKFMLATYLISGINETNKKEAFNLAEKLITTHPNDAKVHAMYGDMLYQDKKLDEARKHYRQSLDLQKDIFLVWQQLILISSELKDWEAMAKESENAMVYFPNQPVLYLFSGIGYTQLKNYKKAIEAFEDGTAINFDNPNLQSQFYTNIADAYHRLKDNKSSDEYFEKAIKAFSENATALNNYAYYLSVRNEKLDEAEAMSKKSLEIEPENTSFLDTYGWIMFRKGKYEEAKDYIGRALKKDNSSSEVLEHYGDVLFKLGNIAEAVEYWQKAKIAGSENEFLDKKIRDKKYYE